MQTWFVGTATGMLAALFLGLPATSWSGESGGWVPVNGARLYYEQAGKGPDVVLLHGFSLDRRMWDPQVGPLTSHFRITRYDIRGFGRSVPVSEPHDPVEDLVKLLDQLKIRQAHLVGMSMGGQIALDFALLQPQRVARLVLIGSVMSGFPHADWGPRIAPIIEAAQKGDLARAKQLWLKDRFLTPVGNNSQVAAAVARLVADCTCSQWIDSSLYPRSASPPAYERLNKLNVPTLAIVGESDDPDVLAIAAMIAKQVAGSRTVVIPAAGHLVNLEQAAALNEALISFLRGEP